MRKTNKNANKSGLWGAVPILTQFLPKNSGFYDFRESVIKWFDGIWAFGDALVYMAEPISEKPRKKIVVHSISSFWWRVIKKSFKNAWEPFENFGGVCAIFAGVVAIAYLAHQITQDWTDYMIYWSIAVPVAVWWVWFLWNLIKVPHKIYKDDLAAVTSGAMPVSVNKTNIRNFARFLFVVVIVSAFLGMMAVKNYQIEKLKGQIPPSVQPKPNIVLKPLPTKIIPRPEPPPTPPAYSTQQVAVIETQKQFETFNGDTETTNGSEMQVAQLIAHVKAEKAAAQAEQAAKSEAEHRQRNLDAKKQWDIYLPYYQHSIAILHDILISKSAITGDGISQSVGYFQCLPSTIDCNIGSLKVAEIGFQKNTNMDFLLTITDLNGANHRKLIIACGGGHLELEPANGDRMWRKLHLEPDFDDFIEYPITNANELISKSINLLVDGQIYYLSQTNRAK
ncbi:MAG: hypothetical protein ABSD57_10135 [Verrucomicrobiota bacterium]|jgi:hypothetical protein